MPYYENPGMLREHQRVWSEYVPEDAARLHTIVIDDGSPEHPAIEAWKSVEQLGSSRLYRTLVDVRWNWLFCRNLGVSEATTTWVLLTDIDHLMPYETLTRLLSRELDEREVYRLSRVSAPDNVPYKLHPNTWLMTRVMFSRIGGYDERFSGFYGSDGEFRDRVYRAARAIVTLPEVLIRYPRTVLPDASTTQYGRKEEQDGEAIPRIRAARDKEGIWEPRRLTFPWERVC